MVGLVVVVFSYNRPEMLSSLLKELKHEKVIVIDDGSAKTIQPPDNVQWIRTPHEGKRGFWMKWCVARQLALGDYDNKYFLFLQDDVTDVKIGAIQSLIKQDWHDRIFAVNVCNDRRKECWGPFSTGQEDMIISGVKYQERGFVDCMFFTNRKTLTALTINQVPDEWFDRPDKSSGVGAQITTQLRLMSAPMMMPTPTIVSHGTHPSVMHGAHRKQTILKTV